MLIVKLNRFQYIGLCLCSKTFISPSSRLYSAWFYLRTFFTRIFAEILGDEPGSVGSGVSTALGAITILIEADILDWKFGKSGWKFGEVVESEDGRS